MHQLVYLTVNETSQYKESNLEFSARRSSPKIARI